eukprot:Awhi_evm1s552
MQTLDATWISSFSWYILNVSGSRRIHALILGEGAAPDDAAMMQQQMGGQAGQQPGDMNAVFKTESEGLQILKHSFSLDGIEDKLLGFSD